jgi:hypothetical protein
LKDRGDDEEKENLNFFSRVLLYCMYVPVEGREVMRRRI